MTQTDSLAPLLTDDTVVLNLRAASKPALIAELARRAAGLTGLSEANLTAALVAREALGSTGFGAGVAVPHARVEGLARVFCLLARLEKPVAYDAIDDRPVDLVVLLLSPSSANSEHLATLAAISRKLRDKTLADALRNAPSASAARAILCPDSAG